MKGRRPSTSTLDLDEVRMRTRAESGWISIGPEGINSVNARILHRLPNHSIHTKMQHSGYTACLLILLIAIVFKGSSAELYRFQEVIEVIQEKRLELSHHDLFKFLADESIPASKRIQFAPYNTITGLTLL
jgi:hypothetical protein